MGAGKIEYRHREQRPELLPGEARSARASAAILRAASDYEIEGGGMSKHDHAWKASDIPGVCLCECGSERYYSRQEQAYFIEDGVKI